MSASNVDILDDQKFDAEWKATFLRLLAESPNVTSAAKGAGVSRSLAYLHREKDPAFAAGWGDAIGESLDRLEESAFKRANSTSDTLAIFLLKSHRPDVYRETVNQHQSGGLNIRVEYVDSDADDPTPQAP